MPWPVSQDYNEAVQDPASCFADADLRAGQAATNALGLPLPCSGNFADVYQLRCPGGEWAVKCFTRQVSGLHERYAAVSEHLAQARLSVAVEFQYLDQGIQIHGAWYPVVKMRWVEGLTLNEFVRSALDRPALLDALGQLWVRMGRRLRECQIAHGDLQHGNVLLVPGRRGDSLHRRPCGACRSADGHCGSVTTTGTTCSSERRISPRHISPHSSPSCCSCRTRRPAASPPS